MPQFTRSKAAFYFLASRRPPEPSNFEHSPKRQEEKVAGSVIWEQEGKRVLARQQTTLVPY